MSEYEIINLNDFYINKKFKKKNIESNSEFIIIDQIKDNILTTNRVFINGLTTENVVYLDFDLWYNDIKRCYKNKEDIYKQFIIDNKRGDFYFNGNRIMDPQKLMSFLDYKYNSKLMNKIILFCTQASLGIPYEIIINKINLNSKKKIYHVGEIPITNNYINKKYIINFTINDNRDVTFLIQKKLRIFKVIKGNDYTCGVVSIFINFNLNDKNISFRFIYEPIVRNIK